MTISQNDIFDLDAAPLDVAHAMIVVRDLEKVTAFYRDVVGLRLLSQTASTAVLGASRPFLTLREDPAAEADDPRLPGMFHIAFLLPQELDLGRWARHAARAQITIDGASDHHVSKAIYLTDPEGNGVEIYVDRPTSDWQRPDGSAIISTNRLDFGQIPADDDWRGAPGGTRIGHVHLRGSDMDMAASFWTSLGFFETAGFHQVRFFGAGGYHHQIAVNAWRSMAEIQRYNPTATGLAELTIAASPQALAALYAGAGRAAADPQKLTDPFGIPLKLVAQSS